MQDPVPLEAAQPANAPVTILGRLLSLLGLPPENAPRFAPADVIAPLVDFCAFVALLRSGFRLGDAQITSFLLAGAMSYILTVRPALAGVAREQRRGVTVKLLVVAAMAVFLRGGVLALLVQKWNCPPPLAIVFAILAGAAMALAGGAMCLAGAIGRDEAAGRWRSIAIGVGVYLFVLRLIYLGLPELMPEEAYYWNYARHLDIGYLDHPPMVAWLISVGTAAFGQTEFGIRIGAFFCWVVATLFAYRLALSLFDKPTGLAAVLLMQVLPFNFSTGLVMTPDSPLTACWAGALFFLERVLLGKRPGAWWGVGVCMGLGMLSKYTIGLVGLAGLVFILLDRDSRRWLWSWRPYAAAVLALALFSPVIVWNARNGWASFAFQSTRRLAEQPHFSLHELLGSALVLITPTGFAEALLVLWVRAKPAPGEDSLFAWRRSLFARVFTLVPLSVFLAFSLRHAVKLEWTGALWLAVLPAIAHAIVSPERWLRCGRFSTLVRAAWIPTIFGAAVIYGAGLHYLTLGLPGAGYSEQINLLPVGWRDLASQMEGIEVELEHATGEKPLLVGMDRNFIASQLAFYDPDRNEAERQVAGVHLFGGMSLMYGPWFPAKEQDGKAMVLVAWKPGDLTQRRVEKRFERLGPIREGMLTRDGMTVRRFHYRFAYGYRVPKD